MAFHPILFTGEMISANLEGRKTQTRRVVMPQPSEEWTPHSWGDVHKLVNGEPDPDKVIGWGPSNDDGSEAHRCPYGKPGDVLWARETWARGPGGSREYVYLATVKDGHHPPAWKPSIYMPKWACRLWCRIESIRVERVQDISEEDAAAEGVAVPWVGGAWPWIAKISTPWRFIGQADNSPKLLYSHLWDSINAKRGFGWKANPWVWAIKYTVLKQAPEGWADYCRKVAA